MERRSYHNSRHSSCGETSVLKGHPDRRTIIRSAWILRRGCSPKKTLEYLASKGVIAVYEDLLKVIEVEANVARYEEILDIDLGFYHSLERIDDIAYGLEYVASVGDVSLPVEIYDEIDWIIGVNGGPVFVSDDRRIESGKRIAIPSAPVDLLSPIETKNTITLNKHAHEDMVVKIVSEHKPETVYFTANSEIGVYEAVKYISYDDEEPNFKSYGLTESFRLVFSRISGKNIAYLSSLHKPIAPSIPLSLDELRRVRMPHVSTLRMKPIMIPKKINGTTTKFMEIYSMPPIQAPKLPNKPFSSSSFNPIKGVPSTGIDATDIYADISLLNVKFTDSIPRRAIDKIWDFGDGNTSKDLNPIHTYSNYGKYTVRMKAVVGTDGTMYTVIAEKEIELIQKVVTASFYTQSPAGKAPLTVKFLNISVGDIRKVVWSFGDGEISIEKEPVHIYKLPGTYTVSLTVTSVDDVESSYTNPHYIRVRR